ncbi:TPA: helix-turn-helix transcriptional regulator [Staphylococcus aureus]|nr:helix-turn-helix transcriptional regulator [Staphylococcus aureus]MCC5294443.1 helix-turn-helix transcriptional regulator [Staphylococcus aureus]UFA54924.1 helix-turn-helix transcriptional regulator [Staphylococcus aureus]HCZ5734443.1 helix-turn-helix transcriptional regulator [Staphylococcus aureus]HCZ5775509.1 helix-turn-helix transcriptional regulator [Staphylococcus aureus]HDD0309332.1 helix-turn-helix transcriptional regulator [Staphylococcus aureus]
MTIKELEEKFNISRYFVVKHDRDWETGEIIGTYIVLDEYADHIDIEVEEVIQCNNNKHI